MNKRQWKKHYLKKVESIHKRFPGFDFGFTLPRSPSRNNGDLTIETSHVNTLDCIKALIK